MSIIIRLQNLPWSANSVDIRRFFNGLSIPEGGVHIVGGEMGDAFIAFSTDEDARLAMAKDGGKIKDMQIKLLLSSRTEMMRVIEQARQQNMVVSQPPMVLPQTPVMPLQQPARSTPPASEPDRRRGRSPNSRHRSRDRSPARDRRRSPDDRRSKRDRSRSPGRSSRFSRDDRRSDRFKRDERRYDDSRYRDDRDRRSSGRDPPVSESKKYADADHVNSRSQLHSTEGFRDMQHVYDAVQNIASMSNLFHYGNQQMQPQIPSSKSINDSFTRSSSDSNTQVGQSGSSVLPSSVNVSSMGQQKQPSLSMYPPNQIPFQSVQFNESITSAKDVSISDQQQGKQRRRTRFEPEFTPSDQPPFTASNANTKIPDIQNQSSAYSINRMSSENRNAWGQDVSNNSENTLWNEKTRSSSNPSITANGDIVQVVPMDLDPPDMSPESLIENVSSNVSYPYARNDNSMLMPSNTSSMSLIPSEGQNREINIHGNNQSRGSPMNDNRNRGYLMHNETSNRVHPLNTDLKSRSPVMHSAGNRNSPILNDPNRGSHVLDSVRPSIHENPNRGSSIRMDMYNRGSIMHGDNQKKGQFSDNDNHGRIPASLTVEVRGLPPDARIDDILDLFRGISLPAANIRIEASDRGFEKAFIRFTSAADFEEALNRNRRFVNEGRCELVPCPEAEFDGARAQKSKPRPKPREDDLIVQLRGLPFQCKDDDVVKFFDGLTILDLFIQYAPDGRATGIGFVEFGSPKDFRSALAMNGKMISHRYITVSVGSKEMLAVLRGEVFNPEDSQENTHGADMSGPPASHGRPLLPMNQVRPPMPMNRPPPSCIFMKGLPEGVTNKNIADFLGQAHIMPRAIHIMLRPDTTPSGEAYAEFTNPANMDAALQLNGKLMSGNRVEISPISFFEMSEILGRPVNFPPSESGLLRTPTHIERPRGPLLPQGPREAAFRERPRMDHPMRGGRPRMDAPGRPPFGRMRGPWPNRPRLEGRFPHPPIDRGPKDFGSPGCVVSIHNLHYRAGLEELLEFFHGYNITKDSIIRKYNENGQTTGEARVAFQNPRDAQKVVRELNQKPIMGRPLALSIL